MKRSRGSFSGGPLRSSAGLQTGMRTLSNSRSAASPGYLPAPKRMPTSTSSTVEVAHLVGDVEAQLDVGPDCAKAVDAPHQPFGGEMRVGRHLEQRLAARQLLCPRHGAVQEVDGVGRGLGQHGARFGQPHGAAGAGKQRHAELVLDFLDLMADRRRRQAELVGGAGEIQVPGRRFQRPQGTGTGHETSHDLQDKFDDPVKTTRFPFRFQWRDGDSSKKSSNRISCPEKRNEPCPSSSIHAAQHRYGGPRWLREARPSLLTCRAGFRHVRQRISATSALRPRSLTSTVYREIGKPGLVDFGWRLGR